MHDIDKLLERVSRYASSPEIQLIRKAYEFADKAHEGQMRLSGDPFITHPLEVAFILAELEQDVPTITASLLHDSVEDGNITPQQIKDDFGETVARLVMGVTKLGQISFGSKEERQAENFRKMFVSMAEDLRIIIIKLADRLHNMQTLKHLPPEKQKEISTETMEIYAPLAHRLGMWQLKWELEDLAFSYLERDKYDQIKALVSQKKIDREKYIDDFIGQVSSALGKVGIMAQISGRSKHFYSIYNKIVQKNIEFDDIYDLVAVRVIVESVKECYAVLGVVHSMWKPIPGRFRDFIAVPKSNGYQTLHTTIIGPEGRPVEIQIRTKEMHRIAEYGIAAHWKYKEGGDTDRKFDSKLAWIRQLLDNQSDIKDAKVFLENLKIDLFMDEVFVYSPKGDVYTLPIDATPIDFAYHVHTQVGHRCIGAKVNGKIMPLDTKLKSGDIIEVLTCNRDNPRLDWLSFAATSGAKAKIKSWFKKQKREDHISSGRELLKEELHKIGAVDFALFESTDMSEVLQKHSLNDREDILAMIGRGELNAATAAKEIRLYLEKKKVIEPLHTELIKPKFEHGTKHSTQAVRVSGMDNLLVRYAKCCFPLPGDEIVGFITRGRGVTVHRADCPNILTDNGLDQKLVPAEWNSAAEQSYRVNIEVEAFDRVGLLKDVVNQISETKTNIATVELRTKKSSAALIGLVLDIKSVSHLKNVMDAIRKVADVYDVYRVTIAK